VHECSRLATIVIVNYNYDEFVAAAIDSALAQSYAPLEVIVVDDGSTDGSRRIMSAYGSRIRTVFQNNAGQGAAYNTGWSAARGEIVLFLDSDDALTPDAIAKVAAAFKDSDAVKAQFYLAQVDRDMKPLGYRLPSYNFTRLDPRLQIANYGYYVCPPASGNAFRKSFLDEIMPIADQARYRNAPDGYTTGLAGIAGRVVSIPETLGYYRIHGNNIGGEGGVRSLKQLHHMFMRDVRREGSEHAFGDHFDFHFLPDRSRYCPGHTKLRLLSRRIFPDAHPIRTDNVMDLMGCGLVSAFRFPHLTLGRRFSVAIGFLALGLIPRFMLRAYFDSITSAQKRNKTAAAGNMQFDAEKSQAPSPVNPP
jgi:glycosyltransferase involved in cell wall biosynthesis